MLPFALQFSLGLWTFFDATILSAHAHPPYDEPDYPVPVHVTFADWVPGLCSLLGILVINLIDKDRIRGEDGFGDSRAVWRARLFLFVGFALMAGGLAGSVVRPFSSQPPKIGRSVDMDCIYRHCWCSSTSSPGTQININTTAMPTSRRMCPSCSPQSYSGSRKAGAASTSTISRFKIDFLRVSSIL